MQKILFLIQRSAARHLPLFSGRRLKLSGRRSDLQTHAFLCTGRSVSRGKVANNFVGRIGHKRWGLCFLTVGDLDGNRFYGGRFEEVARADHRCGRQCLPGAVRRCDLLSFADVVRGLLQRSGILRELAEHWAVADAIRRRPPGEAERAMRLPLKGTARDLARPSRTSSPTRTRVARQDSPSRVAGSAAVNAVLIREWQFRRAGKVCGAGRWS